MLVVVVNEVVVTKPKQRMREQNIVKLTPIINFFFSLNRRVAQLIICK